MNSSDMSKFRGLAAEQLKDPEFRSGFIAESLVLEQTEAILDTIEEKLIRTWNEAFKRGKIQGQITLLRGLIDSTPTDFDNLASYKTSHNIIIAVMGKILKGLEASK